MLGPKGDDHICISSGTLDQPTGLKTVGHVWPSRGGDYYELSDDLQKCEMDSSGKFVPNEG